MSCPFELSKLTFQALKLITTPLELVSKANSRSPLINNYEASHNTRHNSLHILYRPFETLSELIV